MRGLTIMKFYSEKLDKLFDSEKLLTEAENQHDVEQAAKAAKEDKLKKERKQRAKEVDEAYKRYMDLLNAFLKDYKTYHVSFRSDDGMFTDFFKYAFSW